MTNLKTLTDHMRVHTGENPYSCDKIFTVQSNPNRQMILHTCELGTVCMWKSFCSETEFYYKCDICSNAFINHYSLNSFKNTFSSEVLWMWDMWQYFLYKRAIKRSFKDPSSAIMVLWLLLSNQLWRHSSY